MDFLRPEHKTNLILLILHFVEKPTDSTEYGIDTVLF